jgi:hypothetical protein
MEPKDALTLFMSIEALLLAASAVGVAVFRSKKAGEDVAYSKHLAWGCFVLTVILSVGGGAAWIQLITSSTTSPDNWEQVIEVAAIVVGLVGLPWVAYEVARGAS